MKSSAYHEMKAAAEAFTAKRIQDDAVASVMAQLKPTPPVLAAPANSAVLPELPDHPEPQVMKWSELEKKAIRTYGQACAAAALAASAPKVQMTDLEIIEIATATRTAESNKDGGYILPISFARAILARSAPNAELVAALKQLADTEYGCGTGGCVPCVGQCMSAETLEIVIDSMKEDARAALAAVGEA